MDWDNRYVRELPGEAQGSPRPHAVHGAMWSPVTPTPVSSPRLLCASREAAALCGLDVEALGRSPWLDALAGNRVLEGMQPYSAAYGGHQFGHWAGQLGDGRAITLGELVHEGVRSELQLKGAGLTPYSRTADGRAVLRSSIREFLCSEAMHHLGVPTTRALSLVATGDEVVRDMFYDGRPQAEPGAIVCRVAPSFIRFGHFELPAARKDHALLERLVDFTIARDFPHLAELDDRRARWFVEVCERTSEMVAQWMRVGFVHGVMNTDNMSILGLTIDYGPYGWIDDYDPNWTPNTTDAGGRRYRFGHQPHVARWNLERLAEALLPVFGAPEPLDHGLGRYADVYNRRQAELTAQKLGLRALDGEDDERLVLELFSLMHRAEIDMTIFFRALAEVSLEAPSAAPLADAYYDAEKAAAVAVELDAWLSRWAQRARRDDEPGRRARMRSASPRYVLRNYLAQEVIDAAEHGDAAPIARLLELLRRPYDDQPDQARHAAKRPDWARTRAGCSMLSCSS